MSAIASFYLMSKDKFDEYCKMAHFVPRSSVPQNRTFRARAVTKEEMESAEFRDKMDYHKKLWEFLQKNSKEPYEYNWSGYVFLNIFHYLKEQKKIDLTKNVMVSDESEIFVFDKAFKDEYLEQLDPSKFKEAELKYFYLHYQEEQEDRMFKAMASILSKEEMKRRLATRKSQDKQFPEAGKAMMDGIRITHQCLQLVDDKSIVFLRIG